MRILLFWTATWLDITCVCVDVATDTSHSGSPSAPNLNQRLPMAPGTTVYTDQASAYRGVSENYLHAYITHGRESIPRAPSRFR